MEAPLSLYWGLWILYLFTEICCYLSSSIIESIYIKSR